MTKDIFQKKKVKDFELDISHPDKLLYSSPKLTKLDLLNYYDQVAQKMLPHLKNRLLSVVRCPGGISDSCFYMKHPTTDSEWIELIPIEEKTGDEGQYFYLKDKKGLLYQVGMNSIEFHSWGSKVNALEKPDRIVFDLDPDEDMALDKVQQGVRDLKAILDDLSLNAYLKTSGGKGYHVLIPLTADASWDQISEFAKKMAEKMTKQWPERYTSSSRKEDRQNKIFVDWLRNNRGATVVAPYAIRARPGAKVSMPISWDELHSIAPDAIDMKEAIQRIETTDPWADFFTVEQKLN